jgi:hypothetical protein
MKNGEIDLDRVLLALQKKQQQESSWDERALHVSDIALCKRQVWARRNGLAERYSDLDSFIQMSLGLKYEQILCDALDAAGVSYAYQVPITKTIFGYPFVGTADFVFEDAVLDTKTTTFWSGYVGAKADRKKIVKIPEEPKMGYRIQACAYAIALGKPRYGIQAVCRSSGKRATFWFDTSDIAEPIGRAVVETDETRPGEPEPVDAIPPWYTNNADGTSWQCSYCPYAACEKNRTAALAVF